MSTLQKTPPPAAVEPAAKTKKSTYADGGGVVGKILGAYIPLIIASLVMVLPIVWMLISSLKQPDEFLTRTIQWLPSSMYWGNYVHAAQEVPFARDFVNSLIVTAVGAGIKVLMAVFTAYALVFVRFPFKRVIFLAILVALMVPPQVSILPNFVLIAKLGGQNTYWGIILPGLGTAFGTFLLRQHFMTLPAAIMESAELDGAGHWKRLVSIVAPMSAPTIATVALVCIVNEWNDYLWPVIIINDPHMMTLPVGLTLLQNSEPGAANWGIMMAGAVLVIVPILMVFAFLQRYIVSGLTQGAVTG